MITCLLGPFEISPPREVGLSQVACRRHCFRPEKLRLTSANEENDLEPKRTSL